MLLSLLVFESGGAGSLNKVFQMLKKNPSFYNDYLCFNSFIKNAENI